MGNTGANEAPTTDFSERELQKGRVTFAYTDSDKGAVFGEEEAAHREGLAAIQARQEGGMWQFEPVSSEFAKKNSSYNLSRPDLWVVEGGIEARDRMFQGVFESLLRNGISYFLDPAMPKDKYDHYKAIVLRVEKEVGMTAEEAVLKSAHDKLQL